MNWTEAQAEKAKKLWTVDGWSARAIAKEIGHGITKNAVIGKMHRMGLVQGGGTYVAKKMTGEMHDARLARRRANWAMQRPPKPKQERKMNVPIVRPIPEVIERNPNPTPLSLATDNQCRHIAGEPVADAIICGAVVKPGTSWCPHHHARLFHPLIASKRREPISTFRAYVRAA